MNVPAPTTLGRELLWFTLVGLVGFAVDAVLFVLLHDTQSWSIAAARTLSASCSILTTWTLNRRLTFARRRSRLWGAELVRYSLGQGAGLLVNIGSFVLALALLPPLRAMPIVALAFGAGAALLFNFLTARTLAFRPDAD